MIKTAIILAGGFGTRLRSVVNDVPKPMAMVNGIPFLNYQLNYLKYYGIKTAILSIGYLGEKIKEYYKNNFSEISILYANEPMPLGTGGGMRLAMEQADEKELIVLNGDSFLDVNLTEFYNKHQEYRSDFSIAVRNAKNTDRYGTIVLSEYLSEDSSAKKHNNYYKLNDFRQKSEKTAEGIINGGVYIINKREFFRLTKQNYPFSIEKDFFELKCSALKVGAYLSDGYFIDIGIPEDYRKAQDDFKRFKYR